MDEILTTAQKLRVRKTLIVDRGFQLGLAFRAGLFAFVVLLLLGLGIFVPLVHRLETEPDAHLTYDVATTLLTLHSSFWPVAGLCMVVVVVGALRLSHRVAGPFVRLRRNMEQVGEGVLPAPLHTRKRDFVKREVDAFNGMVSCVAQRFQKLRAAEARVGQSVEALQAAVASGQTADFEARVAELQGLQAELREQLYVFVPEAGSGSGLVTPQGAVGGRAAAPEPAEVGSRA